MFSKLMTLIISEIHRNESLYVLGNNNTITEPAIGRKMSAESKKLFIIFGQKSIVH
jgi:hypothetical protein